MAAIRADPPGPAEQRGHFFWNVDDDLGFAQPYGQPFFVAAQLLEFFGRLLELRLWATGA